MKNLFFLKYSLLSLMLLAIISCNDDNSGLNPDVNTKKAKHVVARFDNDDTQVYIASPESLDEGELTFIGNGMHLNPVRSARVFTDNEGWVYVFNYGGGYLEKFAYNNGKYISIDRVNVAPTMGGNPHVRPWKINEQTILVHNINTEDVPDPGNGITKEGSMYVTRIAIPSNTIQEYYEEPWEVPVTEWDIEDQAYPFRIDAPTVVDGKIYYGVGRMQLDESKKLTGMHTIIMDYPTLENPIYIRSDKGHGNTNGFRGLNMHEYNGYVYQANAAATPEDPTVILRIKDGAYDDDYVFDVCEALGERVHTNKWYHVEGSVYYMSVKYHSRPEVPNPGGGENLTGELDPRWGLIRIDIEQQTAEPIDVPLAAMFAYQSVEVKNGKFYMAISPFDSQYKPAVYIIDTNTNVVSVGLSLDEGNIRAEGIF